MFHCILSWALWHSLDVRVFDRFYGVSLNRLSHCFGEPCGCCCCCTMLTEVHVLADRSMLHSSSLAIQPRAEGHLGLGYFPDVLKDGRDSWMWGWTSIGDHGAEIYRWPKILAQIHFCAFISRAGWTAEYILMPKISRFTVPAFWVQSSIEDLTK